jgi:hypothetical protein
MPVWWRRVTKHFGISAPRMAVRTRLPWWGRGLVLAVTVAVIVGMWWWGFDFGQILGGFNRKEIEGRLFALETDATKLRTEASELRARNSALESELGMTRGAQEALTKQASELSGENAQIKEELAFLQKLVSDSSKTVGLQIQRIAVEPDGDGMWQFSLLIVRGGSPKEEFNGNVVVQATVVVPSDGTSPPRTILLPEDEPATAPALILKFKYYQRVEGRFRVPPGGRVTAVAVRCFEAGQGSNPRAARTLSLG